MLTNGDHEGRIFLSHPHTNNGLFFFLNTKYLILYEKDMKRLSENPEFAEMRHGEHYNDVTDSAVSVRLFFYLSLGLVRVCEINRIHHWCSVGTEKS